MLIRKRHKVTPFKSDSTLRYFSNVTFSFHCLLYLLFQRKWLQNFNYPILQMVILAMCKLIFTCVSTYCNMYFILFWRRKPIYRWSGPLTMTGKANGVKKGERHKKSYKIVLIFRADISQYERHLFSLAI